jgi:hypothetical protein
LSSDSAGFSFAHRRTVKFNLNISYFRELKTVALNLPAKAGLLVGQAIISIKSFKSGIARFFSLLEAAEKVGKGLIQSLGHILKHLGIDFIKGRTFFLQGGNRLALLEIADASPFLLPSTPTLLQKMIVQPSAFIKLFLKKVLLFLGGEQSIFKGFIHMYNYTQLRAVGQLFFSRFIPRIKIGGFLGSFL